MMQARATAAARATGDAAVVYGRPELATYKYADEVIASWMDLLHGEEHVPDHVFERVMLYLICCTREKGVVPNQV
ncbi:hypothetical protein C8A01DRAFT_34311 [Parachaetomium inaequale]|uniref:Uncharacterized protein n=1 Tax=Parachaetomium inaequale TaxID=2588326 RepID=A0AAN6STI7_9PEZI|nr:hypothetical protein C8A01DRAFT_34311 [Parachaetomium inaequale]